MLTYKYSNHLLDRRKIVHPYISDDNRGMVIVEGYINPDSEPVPVREWELSKVEPTARVEQIYESNYEPGMSERTF